jgi:universal stress protein E
MASPETKELRRVVLASDFSPGARRALRRAQQLPFAPSAEIVVAHVLPPGKLPANLTRTSQELLGHDLGALRAALQRKGRADIQIRVTTRLGTPPTELVKLAREATADLIVCGRHGAGKMRGLLLGSTAERVVHQSDVPVLAVGAQAVGPYTAPLVALTADERAHFVLDAALPLIPPGVRINAVTTISVPLEGWLWGGWTSSKEILRLRKRSRGDTERTLKALLAPYRQQGVRLRLALVDGDPRRGIVTVAKRTDADLIAMGTHARPGAARFPLGSVAAFVVRHAPCDVLVARAPGTNVEAS